MFVLFEQKGHTDIDFREQKGHTDKGYDTFDDAYTRFAGRGAWSRGFDAEQL